MEKKTCLNAIKNCYNNLTDTEKKVCDFIKNNREEVMVMPISVFSKKSGCVQSAIVRTCKSLGFSGYSDMKIALAVELSKNKQLNFAPYISPHDNVVDILNKVFSADVKALHDNFERIDIKSLELLIEKINSADNVYIYGIGTSASIARELQFRLMQFGYRSAIYNDVVEMKVSALNITENDLVVGISHSGTTKATIDALEIAKESGATLFSLTSYKNSKITTVTDNSIIIYSDEVEYPIEAVTARIAYFALIDTIAIALSSKQYDKAVLRNKKVHDVVNTIRYK